MQELLCACLLAFMAFKRSPWVIVFGLDDDCVLAFSSEAELELESFKFPLEASSSDSLFKVGVTVKELLPLFSSSILIRSTLFTILVYWLSEWFELCDEALDDFLLFIRSKRISFNLRL